MPVARKIADFIERSSWIRAMFEAGAKLKAQKGAENVYDFSLGNPNIEPPERFFQIMQRLAEDRTPGRHAYMPNAGYPQVRAKVAAYLNREHGPAFSENEIVMTVGAAGALNIVLKAIVDPGAEVVVPTPYFVEYDFYLDNHGGKVTRVPTNERFELDIEGIAKAIGPNTCAVLINNPNNPTGAVYTQASVDTLAAMLLDKSKQLGKAIYLISDEPYRQIVFDGLSVPSIFAAYPHSIVVTSFSKNLSLPGQRIGYAAVHPDIADKAQLLGGMTLANRILGFVNAPGIMQLAVAELLNDAAEVAEYARKRELILGVLDQAGYEYVRPGGAFYVFPKSPTPDDVAFCKRAMEENLLVVPGSGFMGPGYFRIAYCCDDATIVNSLEAFKRARQAFK